jgi:hypothetical protein
MNETWRKRMIFGLLVIVVIWGYFSLFDRHDGTAPATQPTEPMVGGPAAPATTAKTEITDSLLAMYHLAAWGNDPFNRNPLHVSTVLTGDTPTLHLLGILYRQTGAQALINGRVIGEGDIVEGYRVMSINRENVIVQSDGRTVVLRVGKEAS